MKIFRIILLILGVLFILINTLASFAPITSKYTDTVSLIGWYIGKNLMFVVGFLFLFWAYRIDKKRKKREVHELINSLPE